MNFFTDTSGSYYHSRETHLYVIKVRRSGMWPVGQEEAEGPAGMISLPATPTACPCSPGPVSPSPSWVPTGTCGCGFQVSGGVCPFALCRPLCLVLSRCSVNWSAA